MFELWKSRFKSFIEAIVFEIWDALINDLFIPIFFFNVDVVNKPPFHWSEEDKRKVQFGFKVKHCLINALKSK